jgi:2-hydroxy-6-oxonona-2,4-dienedioate hydrolase
METALVGDDSKPALLILHGMPGSYRQALPLGEDLVDDYFAILPSRPGYGRTPITTGRTGPEQAAAYAALLDALEIETAAVVGISGGGLSAAAFAAQFPERCTSLVLMCALAPHLIEVSRGMKLALRVPYVWEAVGTLERRRSRKKLATGGDAIDAEIRKGLTAAELVSLDEDPLMRERIIGFARSHADAPAPWVGFRNDAANIFAAHRHGPDAYDTVTAPTLVLAGDADTVINASQTDYWAKAIPGARHEVIAGGGHAFLLTRRLQTMPLLTEFLTRSTP